jgi:hypothetical protein
MEGIHLLSTVARSSEWRLNAFMDESDPPGCRSEATANPENLIVDRGEEHNKQCWASECTAPDNNLQPASVRSKGLVEKNEHPSCSAPETTTTICWNTNKQSMK